ncbi:MAG: hypothetical protein HY761_04260 [Candidatus Omnitrophica bacterium]|nr:hypothetical protein [Candidatus Omnitrophota bacterium]
MFYLKRAFLGSLFTLFFLGNALALTPPFLDKQKIRLSIAPGQASYGDIVIENPSETSRKMRVYLEDWSYAPGGDGSKNFAQQGSSVSSCAPWITFSPTEFTLPAFGKQRISFSVKVPSDAKGTHYAIMFFESNVGEVQENAQGFSGGLNLAIRVGALFYIEAKGTIKRSAMIENLSVKRGNASNPLTVQVDLKNSGNTDITAGGSFHIMDDEGLIFARGEFGNAYTFGGETAKMSAAWKEKIPAGKYHLVITVDIGKALEELNLGRGPVIIKETEIEIGPDSTVLKAGELN